MGVNSRQLNEYGYALCGVCRKKFFIGDVQEICEFCGRWYCKKCARPTPPPHGHGKICKKCYDKTIREDRMRRRNLKNNK